MKTVFYAWQSDLPNKTNRSFLEDCLSRAIDEANRNRTTAEHLRLDKDTQGVAGMPIIADVLFEKIAACAVFVPDLSFVTPTKAPRAAPNPNVLVELGFAMCAIGDRRIVPLLNTAFGPASDLPFDLKHRRFPISYDLAVDDPPDKRAATRDHMVDYLVRALVAAADHAPAEPDVAPDPTPPHAAAPLGSASFLVNGGGQIAHAPALDSEGRPSDYIYWHHGPSAWLRVVPTHPKAYRRAELERILRHAPAPLRPFGEARSTSVVANGPGVVTIGFDQDLPDAISTRVTQVFRTGEIWGLNSTLIEPKRTEPIRTFQIPWPALARSFEETLTNYLDCASVALKLEPPLIVAAGLAMVDSAMFIRAKSQWFMDPPREVRCLENFIYRYWTIDTLAIDPHQLLTPLYTAIWDACSLDFAQEPDAHTWPQ